MGGAVRKQFRLLGGVPLVVHSLRVLQASPVIDAIILAVPQADVAYCQSEIVEHYRFTKVIRVVAGGQERQVSVRNALAVVDEQSEIVVVHDAVRPFLTERMLKEVVTAARAKGAAIIALPMRDTVKQVAADHVIERDRGVLCGWSAARVQSKGGDAAGIDDPSNTGISGSLHDI